MKREKRLTKREVKALRPKPATPAGAQNHAAHIHCIACGAHLDPDLFGEPGGPTISTCDHGSDFPHCGVCTERAKALILEHDQSGQPVKTAQAWH